jgi:hypothetical protein
MPNPWLSLRCDQLIPVRKQGSEQERTIGKRAGGGEEKNRPIVENWPNLVAQLSKIGPLVAQLSKIGPIWLPNCRKLAQSGCPIVENWPNLVALVVISARQQPLLLNR